LASISIIKSDFSYDIRSVWRRTLVHPLFCLRGEPLVEVAILGME
jgi:hypothetical protein